MDKFKVGDLVKYSNDHTNKTWTISGIFYGPVSMYYLKYYLKTVNAPFSVTCAFEESLSLASVTSSCPVIAGLPVAAFQVGDKVDYYGHEVEIIRTLSHNVWGYAEYEIKTKSGSVHNASEIELTATPGLLANKYPAEYDKITELPVGSQLKGGGCECGAWIGTFKDDHMGWCPKFKAVK